MRRKQTYSLEESIKRALRDPYFYSEKEEGAIGAVEAEHGSGCG
jgi:hypothetical protein